MLRRLVANKLVRWLGVTVLAAVIGALITKGLEIPDKEKAKRDQEEQDARARRQHEDAIQFAGKQLKVAQEQLKVTQEQLSALEKLVTRGLPFQVYEQQLRSAPQEQRAEIQRRWSNASADPCVTGNAQDCYKLGRATPDVSLRADRYKIACELGKGWACNNLGDMYIKGQLGSVDAAVKAAAKYYFSRACDLAQQADAEGACRDGTDPEGCLQRACSSRDGIPGEASASLQR